MQNICYADPTPSSVSQDMQNAITAEQQDSSYDKVYQAIQSTVYSQAATNLQQQQASMIAAVQAAIAANLGNQTALDALNLLLNQLNNFNSSNTFKTVYQTVPTTTQNAATDQTAFNAVMSNINTLISTVTQAEQNTSQQYANAQFQTMGYAMSNASMLLASTPALPAVPDGSPATIYAMDRSQTCYYVNAGVWSGVSVGNKYPIVDASGNFQAYLEIAACANSYSIGVLVYSSTDGVTLGEQVSGLTTCKTPPTGQ
jgi:hypothetical protein